MKHNTQQVVGTFDQVISYTYKNNLKAYKQEIKIKEKEIKQLKAKIKEIEDLAI